MSEIEPEEKKEAFGAPPARITNTGGGNYIEGSVNTGGGNFVGRDMIVNQLPPEPVVPALHQIPAPPPDFKGRKKELRELLKAIKQKGERIIGVQGMGGMGKSALALTLAELIKDQYPDAQLFLECRGAPKELDKPVFPATPAELMEHVIRAFHPNLKLPEDPDKLGALYHSTLYGQKALLLFDDARDADQIEPLLPLPAGCLALVTSRRHFYLAGLYALSLDALLLPDAVSLLLAISRRIGDQAEPLARLCSRLPLALRMTAGALQARIDVEPANYVHYLEDAPARLRLTGVGAVLQASYELLPLELRPRWCILAVFPGSFDAAAAAAVWGIPADAAQDALSELLVRSLLEFEPAARRYRLHDLVCLGATSLLIEREGAQAAKNHAWHYLGVLTQAKEMYKQGGEGMQAGLALFDREWENIRAGQAWAANLFEYSRDAAMMCSEFSDVSANWLELRLHPLQRISWQEAGLKAARLLQDLAAQGNHLGNLGIAYKDLGQPHKAIEYYEQALDIFQQTGNWIGEGAVLGNLGSAYYIMGEPRKAIECYEQRLGITRQAGDRRGEGVALGNLGLIYRNLGETHKAIENFEQAMEIARQAGDRLGEGNALGNLGNAYDDLGEPHKAIEYYEQQLVTVRQIGDRRGEGAALGNMGLAYAHLGESHQAIEYYKQDIENARQTGDRGGEVIASWNLGNTYQSLGDLEKAVACKQVFVDYEKEIGHPDYEKHAQEVAELRRQLEQSPKTPPA